MGKGDNLIATSFAKGAARRGKRVAFGDPKERLIRWDTNSEQIFRDNPNIALPAKTYRPDELEWVPFYQSNRIYNTAGPDRWLWNYDFRVKPGEIYLSDEERAWAAGEGRDFVVMEPNVYGKSWQQANKRWPFNRYQEVCNGLRGADVVQLVYAAGSGSQLRLEGARLVGPPSFRHACALLERAALYIGKEGGLHHAAAAVGTPAVVLFGGWVPPAVLGYEWHANLTGLTGEAEACGLWAPCKHCIEAMGRISVDEVLDAAWRLGSDE